MAASKKTYTLPRGPFVHGAGRDDAIDVTLETVDKVWAKIPKSAQEDYLQAGLVAEVPPEVLRELNKPADPPPAEG